MSGCAPQVLFSFFIVEIRVTQWRSQNIYSRTTSKVHNKFASDFFRKLYDDGKLVANLAIAFEPFLPFSSKDLRQMIGMEKFDWAELGRTDLLEAGHQLGEPHLLFEKIEDETIQKQLDKLAATKKANEAAQAAKDYKAEPIKPNIPFDEWEKLDIRVGHIKDCQAVKKSNKLLQFTIDDGSGTDRTILSGIAKFYKPEKLVGKDVLFIANLAPRKMMGIESQGMILSALNFDGSLSVTTTLGQVKPGRIIQQPV
jgi:methionyl-tRNA synthetase